MADEIDEELLQRDRDAAKARENKRLETPLEMHQKLQREGQEVAMKIPSSVLVGLAKLETDHPRTQKILLQCLSSDEPFICFRAKDIFTPMVIAYYVGLLEQIQPGNSEQQMLLLEYRDELLAWQRAHSSQVRYPD